MSFGAVAIGRNEGERLRRCLASLSTATAIVYVDSASEDGSAASARTLGADVVELDMSCPFTAARARNAGFRRLREIAPAIAYVQFVDADCILDAAWPQTACTFLDTHINVAAVAGRRRERHPDATVYNWLCEQEWQIAPGATRAIGGDTMLRASALEATGGYRDDLIAGEEPELCVRLRAAGWRIWRLDAEMTLHDAGITRFSQWWRRAVRCGYAYANGSYLHGGAPERHWVWETRRAWLWGIWMPLGCLACTILFFPWGLATWLIYPAQVLRQSMRNPGPLAQSAKLALFQILARFAEAAGQLKFLRDRLAGRQAGLIEYK